MSTLKTDNDAPESLSVKPCALSEKTFLSDDFYEHEYLPSYLLSSVDREKGETGQASNNIYEQIPLPEKYKSIERKLSLSSRRKSFQIAVVNQSAVYREIGILYLWTCS